MTETEREFLCFPGPGGVYAVDFEDTVEICIEVNLRPVPLLPDYFCGVFYHKGVMIPVVRMERSGQEDGGRQMEGSGQEDGFHSVLVVKYGKGMFGIQIPGSPWVSSFSSEAEARGDYGELVPERWEVKLAYHEDETVVFLLDIEKSAGKLTAFQS